LKSELEKTLEDSKITLKHRLNSRAAVHEAADHELRRMWSCWWPQLQSQTHQSVLDVSRNTGILRLSVGRIICDLIRATNPEERSNSPGCFGWLYWQANMDIQ